MQQSHYLRKTVPSIHCSCNVSESVRALIVQLSGATVAFIKRLVISEVAVFDPNQRAYVVAK
jgi:hypothetical protein